MGDQSNVYMGNVGHALWPGSDNGQNFEWQSNGMHAQCDMRSLAYRPTGASYLPTENPAREEAGQARFQAPQKMFRFPKKT